MSGPPAQQAQRVLEFGDPSSTANWKASSGNVTVSFGGGAGRVMKLGFQRINWQIGSTATPYIPGGGSRCTMRMQLSFLFPKLTPEEKMMMLQMQLKKMDEQQQKPTPKN